MTAASEKDTFDCDECGHLCLRVYQSGSLGVARIANGDAPTGKLGDLDAVSALVAAGALDPFHPGNAAGPYSVVDLLLHRASPLS